MKKDLTSEKIMKDPPIIISKHTMDDFLKEDNPVDLIGLYAFYYYTAKWQKTNIIKALKVYVLKGAKIGKPRFEKANNTLKKMNLIETVVRKDNKGKITGWYIKLNFIWKQDTVNSLNLISPEGRKLVPGNKPITLSSHKPVLPPGGLEKTNALNANTPGAKLLAPTASTPPASARQPSVEAGENFSTKNLSPSSTSLLPTTSAIVLPMEDKQKNVSSSYVGAITSHLQSLTGTITNNLNQTL